MTKKILLLFICAVLFNANLQAQTDSKFTNREIHTINRVLDNWHERASVADTTYFDLFAPEAIYLGTDPKEIWTAKKFEQLYVSYFRKGNAWNFKKKNRNVYLGTNAQYAWFDETLDTWMGLCRGTGVMEKEPNGQWFIKHYSLTVLVPNDKIKEYVFLINGEK